MMKWTSTSYQIRKVSKNQRSYLLGFFDPDGYFFNEDGFDEFGGYYDNDGFYHPGEKNKHEFPDYKAHENQSDRKGSQPSKN